MSPTVSQLWIGGKPCPSSTLKTFDVINPISHNVVTQAAAAGWEDIQAAIADAHKVQPFWENLSIFARHGILLKAAQLLQTEKYAKKVIAAAMEETAALTSWAEFDVQAAVGQITLAAFEACKLTGASMPSNRYPGGTVLVEKRAFGTVFAIAPFNVPAGLAARAIAYPLICGNSVLLKSAELSPRSSEIVVEALYEAGLPPGVLNLVHIAREDAPKFVADIIGHKLIRHVNFTGSARIGRIIATEAGKNLKPCVLELGGKCPTIVLDDADVENAARSILSSAMVHAGQVCMSNERVIVQRNASEALIEALSRIGQQIRVGPQETNPHIPALISEDSAKRVLNLLEDAKSRGAEMIIGDLTHQGAFLRPHIALGVQPGWPLWEQETFGPVTLIKIVDTVDEAVEFANHSESSLMAAIWTNNTEKGIRISRNIKAGHVSLNGSTFDFEPALGIQGLGGESGYGNFDVDHFTQKRIIAITPPDIGKSLCLINEL